MPRHIMRKFDWVILILHFPWNPSWTRTQLFIRILISSEARFHDLVHRKSLLPRSRLRKKVHQFMRQLHSNPSKNQTCFALIVEKNLVQPTKILGQSRSNRKSNQQALKKVHREMSKSYVKVVNRWRPKKMAKRSRIYVRLACLLVEWVLHFP